VRVHDVGAPRESQLERRLRAALDPVRLELSDESDAHVGHPGAAGGAGHYRVLIVTERFTGLDPVARHRLVYAAVGDLIPDEVHALAIEALAPGEDHPPSE
jgi:BolA family transcriptional regulator, general stress-responsive regulator